MNGQAKIWTLMESLTNHPKKILLLGGALAKVELDGSGWECQYYQQHKIFLKQMNCCASEIRSKLIPHLENVFQIARYPPGKMVFF